MACSLSCETSTLGLPFSIASTVVSRVPLIGTVRKLRQVVTRPRSISSTSAQSDESAPVTPPNSGMSTPTSTISMSRMSEELSMTRLDAALQRTSLAQQDRIAGIDWEAAALGYQMLAAATQRLSSSDKAVPRALYIDAVKYLNSGLPKDLTEAEINSIRELLPYDYQPQPQSTILNRKLPNNNFQATSHPSAQPRNMIRSSTARLITSLLALLMLALPILASLLNRAIVYERQHHLTERAIEASGQLARSAGSAGVTVGDHMVKLSRSQVGVYCLMRLVWVVQSVIEGVGDGVESSLSLKRGELMAKRIEFAEQPE